MEIVQGEMAPVVFCENQIASLDSGGAQIDLDVDGLKRSGLFVRTSRNAPDARGDPQRRFLVVRELDHERDFAAVGSTHVTPRRA